MSVTSAFRAGRGDGGGATPPVPSSGKALAFPGARALPGSPSEVCRTSGQGLGMLARLPEKSQSHPVFLSGE